MENNKSIAVVIPAFCASNTIKAVISGVPDWITDIIIIDDGSPDNTAEVIRSINNPKICLIDLDKNQGVGNAVLTGYKIAIEKGADIIVKMDSDGQMDPKYIESLIKPILVNEANYTKGNRFYRRSGIRKMPLFRKLGNIGLSFMIKMASGYWNIFDPTNGFTAISSKIIPLINTKNIDNRYFFESSLLIELGLLRAVIKDVDIPVIYENEKSHLSEIKSLLEFPPKLLMGFIKRIIYLYFVRDFTPLSFLLFNGFVYILFGLIWGITKWKQSSIMGVFASTGTVMIAVIPIFIGMQFILQAMVMDIYNVPKDNLFKENGIKRL